MTVIPWRVGALSAAILFRGAIVATSAVFAFKIGAAAFAPIALLTAAVPLCALLASAGLDQALFREVVQFRKSNLFRDDVLRTAMVPAALSTLTLSILGIIGHILGYGFLAFAIAGLAGGLQAATLLLYTAFLRSQRSTVSYLIIYLAAGVGSVVVRTCLLLAGCDPMWCWVGGDIAISVIGLTGFLVWIAHCPSGRSQSSTVKLLKFGAPLTVHGFSQWMLGSSDRFIYSLTLSNYQVGLYGAVYQFAGLFNVGASEFNKTGLDRYPGATSSNIRQIMIRDGRVLFYVWLAGIVPVEVALFVLQRMNFDGALKIGSLLYMSFLALIIYLPLANELALRRGRSVALSIGSIAGALVNVVVNILLVGRIGLYAGVVANVLGFGTMSLAIVALVKSGRQTSE